jgi:hypothetical protein
VLLIAGPSHSSHQPNGAVVTAALSSSQQGQPAHAGSVSVQQSSSWSGAVPRPAALTTTTTSSFLSSSSTASFPPPSSSVSSRSPSSSITSRTISGGALPVVPQSSVTSRHPNQHLTPPSGSSNQQQPPLHNGSRSALATQVYRPSVATTGRSASAPSSPAKTGQKAPAKKRRWYHWFGMLANAAHNLQTLSNAHKFSGSPAWLLGRCYKFGINDNVGYLTPTNSNTCIDTCWNGWVTCQ